MMSCRGIDHDLDHPDHVRAVMVSCRGTDHDLDNPDPIPQWLAEMCYVRTYLCRARLSAYES